jgi:hypothetical protein
MPQRSAAQSLYPHLPSAAREPVQQRTPNISDAMWPGLSRAAKAKEHDQQLWDAICRRQRDRLREARERKR